MGDGRPGDRAQELAARIAEVIAAVDGAGGQAFASSEQAGWALTGALARRGRTLLVVDDVWTAAQLEPFTAEGRPWRLLVTTRRPLILDNVAARRITVDAMPGPVARQLLTRDLPTMDAGWERQLLDLTGRWPLLLNLVNHRLARDVARGAAIGTAALAAIGRLRADGPAALDVTDSGQRGTAAKTIQDQLGRSSIVLTADTYISVLPDVARKAAEDTATLVIQAGYLVPGTIRVPVHYPRPALRIPVPARQRHDHQRSQPLPPRPADRAPRSH